LADANRRGWTKEESREAVRRYAAGEDALPLAREYGVTRNAVMGAAHRAGVRRSRNGPSNRKKQAAVNRERALCLQRKRRKVQSVRRQTPKARPAPKPCLQAHPVNDGVGISFMDLEGGHCRWPVSGTEAETRFCGDAQKILPNGKKASYCPAHCQQGTEARKRRPIHSEYDAPMVTHAPGGW